MGKYAAPVISALAIIALVVGYAVFIFLAIDEIDVGRIAKIVIGLLVGGAVVGISVALVSRIKEIREQLSELEAKKKDAEEKLSQYNKKLTHLDKEAEKIVEEYIKIGNQAKDKILKEAKFTAKKMEEQARQNIENEFKQAKLNLQADILERALVKAEKLIKSKITTDDQDRLVDEYFDKVVV